jgi:hypothetical protein
MFAMLGYGCLLFVVLLILRGLRSPLPMGEGGKLLVHFIHPDLGESTKQCEPES